MGIRVVGIVAAVSIVVVLLALVFHPNPSDPAYPLIVIFGSFAAGILGGTLISAFMNHSTKRDIKQLRQDVKELQEC